MVAMAPTIRYATTSDGVRIACATLGEGPPLLCIPPFPFTDLEAVWEIAGQRAWYERLSAHMQVGLYDARGTGLSDRQRAEFDLDAMTRDIDAVVERLGWETFAVCALFNGAPVAISYAAQRPERVTSLVLWGGFARGRDVIPTALPPEAPDLAGVYWGMFVKTAAQMWTAGSSEAAEIAEFFRHCVTPEAALRAFATVRDYDVSALLSGITAPTLVLHRPEAEAQRPDLGIALASAIANAELAVLPGNAASPFVGDADESVRAIERFLGVEGVERTAAALGGSGAVEELTPREAEVLGLLARGLANKEIAQHLGLSVHTVERHLTNLYPKIGCRSRTEATAFALTHGYA